MRILQPFIRQTGTEGEARLKSSAIRDDMFQNPMTMPVYPEFLEMTDVEKILKSPKITKTVFQYSEQLSVETMDFLRGIAEDYGKVKSYVYGRYSGIRNMNRLVPAYNIQREMRHCGLRTSLKLPIVYYECAVAEAVANIRTSWGILKNTLRTLINANVNLNEDDKAYLRTIIKIDSVFAAVLNRQEYELPSNFDTLDINTHRLNNLICRLVRRHLKPPEVKNSLNFRVTPAGYKYKDRGLYLTSRKSRQRIFLPLKDSRTSSRQIHIYLRDNQAVISIPIDVNVKIHSNYTNTVYAYIGYKDMMTLSNGNIYGKDLGEIVTPETERLNDKNRERRKHYEVCFKSKMNGDLKKAELIHVNNLGKIKYTATKKRNRERTQNFINGELNRMIITEKPRKIIITKPVTKNRAKYRSSKSNRIVSRGFGGYIRKRLAYKCQLHGIELVAINSKGTGTICCKCGIEGTREKDKFICESCGLETTIALNSAKNIERISLQDKH